MKAIGLPRYRRPDHHVIASLVRPGERILDVGCGNGQLMALLRAELDVISRGLEISPDGVSHCLARGLSVVQGDAEKDLAVYPDDSFDCAIFSQAIQEMNKPAKVLKEAFRIAPRIIASIYNYGAWQTRISLLLRGRIFPPGDDWYRGTSQHVCTAHDFADLARNLGYAVTAAAPLDGSVVAPKLLWRLNILNRHIVFVLERPSPAKTAKKMPARKHPCVPEAQQTSPPDSPHTPSPPADRDPMPAERD